MAKGQDAGPAAPPRDFSKLLSTLFLVVNILVMIGGAGVVYKYSMGWEPPTLTEAKLFAELRRKPAANASDPLIYTMDKFTVNLDGEPKRTIRVEINLEMLDEAAFEEIMNIETRAKARDSMIRIFNSKSFSELEPLQGKLFLKDEILNRLNGILVSGVVRDVYFTDFVVQ